MTAVDRSWANVPKPARRSVALAGAATALGGLALMLAGCGGARATSEPSRPIAARPPTPGPSSPKPTRSGGAVVVGAGTIDGRPWRVTVDSTDAMLCAGVTGLQRSCTGLGGLAHVSGPASLSGAAVAVPGSFTSFGPPTWNSVFGTVGRNVTRVSVQLLHGATVSLTPVAAAGYRWIGLVLPLSAWIDTVIAYSDSGELAYSVPAHGGLLRPGTYFVTWLRPGQVGPRQAERYLATGGSGGSGWDALVAAGPWGYCVSMGIPVSAPQENCLAAGLVASGVKVLMRWGSPPAVPRWFIGTAKPDVAFLRLTLASGGSIRISVAEVSGQKFYAMEVGAGQAIVRWGAFSGAGRWLYGGSGAPDSAH
jgi:hypothetical protein